MILELELALEPELVLLFVTVLPEPAIIDPAFELPRTHAL